MENNSDNAIEGNEVINLDEADDLSKDTSMETNVDHFEIDLTEDGDKAEDAAVESNEKNENLMVVDEWDDCGFESEDEEEVKLRDMSYMNPEDVERAMLNMPTFKQLTDDIGHLKHMRKVTACPLSILDLTDSHVVELISWNTLHDLQTSFVRDVQNPETFVGIMSMAFTTCKSAENAVEHLKAWKEDIEVKTDTYSHRSMDVFVDKNGLKKKWTDNVAVLKNLSSEVTEDTIRQLFPSVEDVVLQSRKKPSPQKKPSETPTDPPTTTAPDAAPPATTTDNPPSESMETTAEATAATVVTADGAAASEVTTSPAQDAAPNPVSVLPSAPPKGLAYLVFPTDVSMKAELDAVVDKRLELDGHKVLLLAYKAPVHAIPRTYLRLRERKAVLMYTDRCSCKLESLKQDSEGKVPQKLEEKISQSKLVVENDDHSRSDMGLAQPSLEDLKGMNGLPRLNSALLQKTLIRYGILKDKKKEELSDSGKKRFKESPRKYRGGNRRQQSPPRRGRRSPYKRNNARRSYGNPYQPGSRIVGSRNSSQTSLLGNAALVNPLAQLVMQQNLLGSVGLNSGGSGSNYGASAPMDGLLGNPYKGAADNQMIRLDETGNFRVDSETRYPALNRYDDNPRSDNDFRRHSRSPRGEFGRGDSGGGRGGMRGNSGDDSVSLLLNLSQMLNNKMDQKRHQLEQDKRLNYNTNRRYNDY